jgi:hypothetical protein
MYDYKYFHYHDAVTPPVYALYQPVLGVFIMTLSRNDHLMTQLLAVLSSRYYLQPVCVSDAENFTPMVIDNHVCHNWTLSNKQDLNSRTILSDLNIVSAEKLVYAPDIINWDIEQEKRWAMMCFFWLRFIDSLWVKQTAHWIDTVMEDVLDLPIFAKSDSQQFMQKTMQLLYLGKDLEQTDQAITDLVVNNEFLLLPWQEFVKGYNEIS